MYIYSRIVNKLRMVSSIVVLVLLLSTVSPSFAFANQANARMSSPTSQVSSAAVGYGQLPLSFVPNKGQSDAAVRYQARAMGGMLFFKDEAVVLSLPPTESGLKTEDQTLTVVQLHFEGVNGAPRVVSSDQLPGTVNFFIGNDPTHWLTNLPTYAGIVYEQLYPGIDLRYDGAQSTLKGTYTVAPHVDPSLIRWHYEGTTSMRVDEKTGDLTLALDYAGTLIEKAPNAWQIRNGVQVNVTVQYRLMKDGSIGFTLGDYDPNIALTIDPIMIYSTYIGGSAFDGAKSVAVDFAGNAYITGVTQSTNFPTKDPIYDALNGGKDAFIVKINAAGTALIYATYLGGSNWEDDFGSERAGGIAVDSSGYAYVTGCTNSADFPVKNALQPVHGETTNCDVYVTKLNLTGSELIYSTFLGGSGADAANGIAVDDLGSVYIVGDAGKGFPGNPFTSSTHAFVVKINAVGSAIDFSMFLGGSSSDYASDVAVDSAHNIYVLGNTYSIDFPLLNPAQPVKGGGANNNQDAFVTKIKADGSGMLYSTYLGGSKSELAAGIAIDDLGNAYITGMTQSSTDFPIVKAIQPIYGGERGDAFVTKLNPSGNAFVYSTFLGGNNDENYDSGHGPYGSIAVNLSYQATITGYSCSANFPTRGSFRGGKSGSCFTFVTRFNADGDSLVFSTLFGTKSGGSNALATDIALDVNDKIYVVGETNATDFLTVHPFQPSYGGMYDAFFTKLDPRFPVYLSLVYKPLQQIKTLQVTSPNGSEQWKAGTTHTITWKQTGLTGTVTVQLEKGGTLSAQLGTPDAASGSFTWNIPVGQTPGKDYKIRIFQGSLDARSAADFFIITNIKDDFLGVWSTGISSLNVDTNAWNLISSSVATQVAAGDMDGDGIDDIVATFLSSGLWVKYSSNGLWQFIASPPSWITVADFTGDGKADLAGIWGGTIWLRDSATGSWTSITTGYNMITAGDMNGDGKADLIANSLTSGIWVQYSASGAWENLSPEPATWIAAGDFNGDGLADLAGIWSGVVWERDTATGSWKSITSGADKITTGDLDGDGIADLVANYPASGVWVLYSSSSAWSNLTTSAANWIATGLLR